MIGVQDSDSVRAALSFLAGTYVEHKMMQYLRSPATNKGPSINDICTELSDEQK